MALGWRGQYYRYKEYFLNIVALYQRRADLKMFLEVILTLSTVIMFSVFALKPTVITIVGLVKEVEEKEETIVALDQKISNLEKASSIYFEIESLIPKINFSIPDKPNPETLTNQIQIAAAKNSVGLLGMSIGETTVRGIVDKNKKKSTDLRAFPSGSGELPVTISVSGNYSSIISFVRDLERLSRPINIDSISINSSNSDLGPTLVSIISGRVPFLEQK